MGPPHQHPRLALPDAHPVIPQPTKIPFGQLTPAGPAHPLLKTPHKAQAIAPQTRNRAHLQGHGREAEVVSGGRCVGGVFGEGVGE